MSNYLTVEQAADRLGISPRAVLHRIAAGRLAAEKFGSGKTSPWMVAVTSIEQVRVQEAKSA